MGILECIINYYLQIGIKHILIPSCPLGTMLPPSIMDIVSIQIYLEILEYESLNDKKNQCGPLGESKGSENIA